MALDVNLQRISGIYQDMKPSGNFMTDLTFPEEDSTMRKSFVPIDRTAAPREDGIDNLGFQGSESDDEDSASDDIEVNSQYSTEDDEVFKAPDSKPAEANGHVAPTVFEGRRKSSKKKQHAWDVFRVGSNDNVSDAEIACWGTVNVITRVVMCSFMFAIVLVTAFASKLTLFYMIANLFPPTANYNGTLKTLSKTLIWDDAVKTTEITWIWSILIVIAAPYLFVVCKCFWRLCFKKTRPIVCTTLLAVFCTETLHSVGLFVFVLVVLPCFEPVTGSLLCLTVVVIPGLLKVFYPQRTVRQVETSNKYRKARVLNVFAFLCNIGAIGLWCFHVYENEKDTDGDVMLRKGILIALVVLCPIFISLSWWENYVRHGKEDDTGLPKLKGNIRKQRTKISVLVYLWKIILTIIILPSILFSATCKVGDGDKCIRAFFFQISNSDRATVYTLMGPRNLTHIRQFGVSCFSYMPFMFAVINILFNIICFKVGKSACKIVAQRVSYALPLALSTPLVIGVMLGLYSQTASFSVNQCKIPFPHWPNGDPGKIIEVIGSYWPVLVAGALSCLSFLLISNHVWSPSKERLISTDKLFVQHLYCGALIDQSLMLNRRRTDEEFKPTEDNQENNRDVPIPTFSEENFDRADEYSVLKKDDTPMIFMCATMWHESENEMTQILKSIFRMDDDQCARRHLQMFLGIKDPDYYEFEAHIFFDDAFEPHGDGEYEYRVNDYVRQLVSVMDVAASSVHNCIMKIPPPTRIPTPYGGRLIWLLPGGNKIIAHLKDKAKIRHRKRWSQVMYMYYFLGHELLTMSKTRKQKRIISENTFLLALDGDVDFQPAAVQLLVDRMKKNHSVGAACGRIHPIGSGPMVWYQQFEYAISHWLQKAAENVLGCVLCSPGCFSLFRGSALMDDNVMRRYTTPPTEPEHYVQYDQGEDRWLCTLLLQQGYKVEYVAASDALTYAPEGFYEFYNQRRRWSPSTMANIIDLLLDWKNVTRKNEDISKLYVAYQMFLMASSILTPGTIFLMILGAISSAFPAITPTIAMVVNLIPVIGMVVLCFVARTQIQLAYAAIVSTIYSLLMMVVMVGLLKEAVEQQFCSVTTIFLLIVAGIFVISALLHPQEFYCVLHGFLYFLAIPSMSMLLMIYSLGNLHVVSWGTRETKIAAPPTTKKEAEKPKRNAVQTWLDKLGGGDSGGTSDYTFSCGNLMRCMCCPQPSGNSEDMRFRAILDRLDDIESRMTATSHVTTAGAISDTSDPPDEPFSKTAGIFEGAVDRVNPAFEEEKQRVRDELKDPYWIHDEAVREGPLEFLQTDEVSFWRDFIDRYLLPLESNKDHEKQIQNALLELRNKVCLAFLLVNALFVTIVYVLTEVNASDGSLSIPLPNCPQDKPGQGKIEPISFAFTAVFGVMLVTQFICMLFHRLSTFLHITASTEIRLKSRIQKKLSGAPDTYGDVSRDEGLKLVKEMQQAPDVSDTISVLSQETTVSADDVGETIGEKKGKELWRKLGRRRRGEYQNQTLGRNFLKNFEKLQSVMSDDDKMSMTGKTSMLNGIEEKDPKEEKISQARNVFRNRFQRQSLHTIVALAQNDKRKQEIQRRATLVEHMRKKKRMTKFQEIAQRALMNEKRETGNGTGAKKGRVNFGDLAKLAVINEKAKRLEEEEIKQEEKDEEYEMQKSPVRKGMFDKRKPGVIKEEVEDRLEANGSKAAKIDAENGQEWPEEDTYYMNPGEVSQNKTNISNVDVLF